MLPGMPEDDLVRFRDPEIAALAKSMTARLPELADQLAERIRQAVDVYGAGVVVPLDDLRTSCKNHLEFLLGQLTLPGLADTRLRRTLAASRILPTTWANRCRVDLVSCHSASGIGGNSSTAPRLWPWPGLG